MDMAKHWQHTTPRSSDECPGAKAPAKLAPAPKLPIGTRATCGQKGCGRRIYVTRPDEGPESLKVFFRF